MDHKTTKELHLDRRLLHRRGWISRAELEDALEALPDVSAKAAVAEEAPEGAPTSADEGTR